MSAGRGIRRRLAVAAWLAAASPAVAHDGPPYAIVVDRPTGPVLLSVWADPDVGIGTYHVYLEPLGADRPLPDDCAIRISVQPVTGRLPERGYDAEPLRIGRSRHHHRAEVEFDAEGEWLTRIAVRCGAEEAEAEKVVEVTPPGLGPIWDFTLYLFPFAAVAILIVRALVAGRRRPRGSA